MAVNTKTEEGEKILEPDISWTEYQSSNPFASECLGSGTDKGMAMEAFFVHNLTTGYGFTLHIIQAEVSSH